VSTDGIRTLRPLAGVLTATGLALTGTRISVVALPWFVLVTTGSAGRTGLVAFCEMAPYVLVKALIGPMLDRSAPRTVSWVTDSVSAAAVLTIPALHAADALSFPVLLLLVALIGTARAPGDLAKEVMVPEAAERGRIPLERATGLGGVAERLAATVGPAAGGALVALLGPLAGLIVNSACFALGSLVIALVVPRGVGRTGQQDEPAEQPSPGYWRRLGEGMRFLRRDRLLLAVTLMIAVTNLLDAAFVSVLKPVWAKESGNGPAAIGILGTVEGLSAIAGSVVAAAVAHRLNRRLVFFAGFLVAGAPRFLILAADVPLWVAVAVFPVCGFGAGFINPILGAVIYERVPRQLLGRVKGLGTSLAWLGIPLGGLAAGAAVASIGLVPALVAAGVTYFFTTNLAGLRPEWRQMNRRRVHGVHVPDGHRRDTGEKPEAVP
jgi:MFS family permease